MDSFKKIPSPSGMRYKSVLKRGDYVLKTKTNQNLVKSKVFRAKKLL